MPTNPYITKEAMTYDVPMTVKVEFTYLEDLAIRELLNFSKVRAIKYIRILRNCTLMEAKEIADHIDSRNPEFRRNRKSIDRDHQDAVSYRTAILSGKLKAKEYPATLGGTLQMVVDRNAVAPGEE